MSDANILDKIAAYKRAEVAAAKSAKPLAQVMADAGKKANPRGFLQTLRNARAAHKPGLIAEIKKASPSKGLIRADFDPRKLAKAYEAGGAKCLSVLTDTPSFQGAPEFLTQAREAVWLPVLRKDFMVDPYQVPESAALGADCILIILAMLDDAVADQLQKAARDWGIDALVEVHDEVELKRALALGANFIGVNNRDLRTFHTDIATSLRLKPMIPDNVLVVAERDRKSTRLNSSHT